MKHFTQNEWNTLLSTWIVFIWSLKQLEMREGYNQT